MAPQIARYCNYLELSSKSLIVEISSNLLDIKKDNGSSASNRKRKHVEATSEKLVSINEDTEGVIDDASKAQEKNVLNVEDIEFFNSFIKGQGSLYILGNCNRTKIAGKIIDNGPVYKERQWNPRGLNSLVVTDMIADTAGGTQLYPKFQEHALTFAVSNGLLEGATLSKYQSNQFPPVFLATGVNGEVLIVNGHHRIAVYKEVNASLLGQLSKYKKTLSEFKVASDNDTADITSARAFAADVEKKLWEGGQWGVIFLDLDKIMVDPRREEIKAYFARNPVHFHYPDDPQDILNMLLKSVQGMSIDKGFEFLEGQLEKSDLNSQVQLRRIVKNPHLLFIFADLITIPMFEKLKIINFSNLTKWRNIVPCWLSMFMDFARDTYQYLAFPPPPFEQISSILDIKSQDISNTAYTFGFLDTPFHDIIEEAYKKHLAHTFLAFGCSHNLIVNGVERDNWTESFKLYRTEVLGNLTAWVEGPNRPKKYRAHLNVLVKRVTYILDDAYKVYPYIAKLKAPLPLPCKTFILDIGKSLHTNEMGILEFLTLFEPTIAIRYGFKKKTAAPIDLMEMLLAFATIPAHGIGYNADFIKISDAEGFKKTLEEVWAAIFGARGSAISAIQTMALDRKHLQFKGIAAMNVKNLPDQKKESGNFDPDGQTALGLSELMNDWIVEQGELDRALSQENLTQEQTNFIANDTSKIGCLMPPSAICMPDAPYHFAKAHGLDDIQKDEITSCLNILRSSYVPWGRQFTSARNQHTVSIATGTIQLNRNKDIIFKHYLGENTIWEAFSTVLALVQKISPHFLPWHGVIPANRQQNNKQIIPTITRQEKEEIGSVVGAGMASTATAINQRYQGGINKLINLVHSTAAHKDGGQTYISRDVNKHLRALVRALGQECVHQAFAYDQNESYPPFQPLEDDQADAVLKDRLGITYPDPDVEVMAETKRLHAYCSDGALSAYHSLINSSYGVQTIKMEEEKALLKAQRIVDKKGKKRSVTQNTLAEDNAINRHDSNEAPHLEVPPSNQLAQKRPRTVSSEIPTDPPQHKRGRHQNTSPELDKELDLIPSSDSSLGKNKNTANVLSSSSHNGMDMEIDDVESLGPDSGSD